MSPRSRAGKNLEVNGTATLQSAMTVAGGSLVTTTLVADSSFNLLGGTVETGATTLNGQVVVDGGIFDANSMTVSSTFDLLRGTVEVAGNLVLNPGATFLIDGGTLTVGSIQNPGRLDFRSGLIDFVGDDFIVGAGEPWGALVRFGAGQAFRAVGNSPEILSNGTLLLEGGKLEIDNLLLDGLVHMSGVGSEIRGETIFVGGELAGHGRLDILNGVEVQSGGQITLTGGQLWLDGGDTLFVEPGGLVMGNGTLRVDGFPGVNNDGDMAFSGLTNIIGDVHNNATGVILSTGGGPVTFYDDVVNNGEVRTSEGSFTIYLGSFSGNGDTGTGTVIMEGDLKPGSSPGTMAFGGDLSFGPAAGLEIEIGGLIAGSEFDQLTIANDVTLGGTLDVSLIDLFTLSPGQSFEIIDVDGSSDGTFLGLDEGDLVGQFDGINLLITYAGDDGNDVLLLTALPGDFDIDGDVDGADFLMWQRDSSVGDLADWQANFGSAAGSLAANSTTVPEPSALLLGVLASLFTVGLRRRV